MQTKIDKKLEKEFFKNPFLDKEYKDKYKAVSDDKKVKMLAAYKKDTNKFWSNLAKAFS